MNVFVFSLLLLLSLNVLSSTASNCPHPYCVEGVAKGQYWNIEVKTALFAQAKKTTEMKKKQQPNDPTTRSGVTWFRGTSSYNTAVYYFCGSDSGVQTFHQTSSNFLEVVPCEPDKLITVAVGVQDPQNFQINTGKSSCSSSTCCSLLENSDSVVICTGEAALSATLSSLNATAGQRSVILNLASEIGSETQNITIHCPSNGVEADETGMYPFTVSLASPSTKFSLHPKATVALLPTQCYEDLAPLVWSTSSPSKKQKALLPILPDN
jgi:hypothetical protein